MNSKEFQALLENTMAKVDDVLGSKAAEYAVDDDRMHNFKQAAHLEHTTPIKALGGMMGKHTVSIYDMIDAESTFVLEKWDEKIIDHINYLILLRALVVEEATVRNTEMGMTP